MLKPYLANCVNAMLTCLFSLETLSSGTMLSFSNSVTTTIEECDETGLEAPLRAICENVYTKINEFMQNPALMQELNME